MCVRRGIHGEVYGGVFRPGGRKKDIPHAWLRHKQQFIDITFTQFKVDAEAVTILPLNEPRLRGEAQSLWFTEVVAVVVGYSRSQLDDVEQLAESIFRLKWITPTHGVEED